MEWKDWVLIAVILLAIALYKYHEQTSGYIDDGINKIKDLAGQNSCTDITEPVCAGNVTYKNSCYAEKKTKDWVIGECQV